MRVNTGVKMLRKKQNNTLEIIGENFKKINFFSRLEKALQNKFCRKQKPRKIYFIKKF